MNDIEIIVERSDEPEFVQSLPGFVDGILQTLGIENWQMSLMISDDEGIREYNRQWRDRDEATDVLSFVQEEGDLVPAVPGMPKVAGDIIVSLDTVARNAEKWGNSYDEELRRVVIHGILHLCGMDHPGDNYESGMLKKQEELLAGTGSLMQNNL